MNRVYQAEREEEERKVTMERHFMHKRVKKEIVASLEKHLLKDH
jgi:hypothetical protein